jgi:hypothetical protein
VPIIDVPSFAGRSVDNRDAVIQATWVADRPLVDADIKQDRRGSLRIGERIASAQTPPRFACVLRSRASSYVLIWVDWTDYKGPSKSNLRNCFELTVADALSPMIHVARAIGEQLPTARSHPEHRNRP